MVHNPNYYTVIKVLEGKAERCDQVRELLFMENGSSVRLRQRLLIDGGEIMYDADILPSSDCSECSSQDISNVDDICKALQKAHKFEAKSRPHWKSHETRPDPLDKVYVSVSVEYPKRLEHLLGRLMEEIDGYLETHIARLISSYTKTDVVTESCPVFVYTKKR